MVYHQKYLCCCLAIVKCLRDLKNSTNYFVSAKMARVIRNYLIFLFCATNALRSSNIQYHENDSKRFCRSNKNYRLIKSIHYKTSFLYREKGVCITEEIYIQSVRYKDYLRPLLVIDEELPGFER